MNTNLMNACLMRTSLFAILILGSTLYSNSFEKDTLPTSQGDVIITFVGHGSLILQADKKVIHIDPWSKLGDYSKLPKADFIFITHAHPDHLDTAALKRIESKKTGYFLNEASHKRLGKGTVLKNGDTTRIGNIKVEATPAYNLVHKNDQGEFWHPKGDGNGYLFTIGDKRIFVAGDTENIQEFKELDNVDYAFLPMNTPYTMTPKMVEQAVGLFQPKVLYPYHTGETKTAEIVKLLAANKNVEVRIRKMK